MCVIQQKGLGDIGLGGNEVLGSCEERGTKGGSLEAEGNSGPPAMCLLGQGPQVEPPAAELAQAQDNTSLGEGNFLLRGEPEPGVPIGGAQNRFECHFRSPRALAETC